MFKRNPLLLTGVFCSVIAIALLFLVQLASATNVDVSQSAKCVSGRTFEVTVTAHNTYDKVLHVTVKNPASDIGLTLQPGQSWSYTWHNLTDPWKVTFTTTDAHLIGETSHTWTAEDVCGVPATTTTSPPVTTCQQANPPRTDCSTVVATTVVESPSTTVPPTEATAPEPETAPPSVSAPATTPKAATATTLYLPATGFPTGPVVAAAIVLCLAGLAAVLIASVKHRSPNGQ
jgi:hypothetical protein